MAQVCLLAAGRGRRAGAPKAWLPFQGLPLIQRQLDFLKSRFSPPRIAVSIQPDWMARCRALCAQTRWVGVDPDLPALASLQALIKENGPCPDQWLFVYHVDMPVWEPALFDALESRAGVTKAEAVAPAHEGRKGHPVFLSPRAVAKIAALDPGVDRLDAWLRGRRVEIVETPWPCVRENWNHGAPA